MTPEQLERCQRLASSGVVGADVKALLDELKDRAWWEQTALYWQAKAHAMQWQPIETAPKDGTWVVLWSRGNRLDEDNERPIVGRWSGDDPWGGWAYPGFGGFRASHWTPVLSAPEVIETEGKQS